MDTADRDPSVPTSRGSARPAAGAWVVGGATIAAAVLTIGGLLQSASGPQQLPELRSLAGLAAFLAGCVAAISAGVAILRRPPLVATAGLGLLIVVLAGEAGPLLAVTFCAMSASAMGFLVLRALGLAQARVDEVTTLLVGAGAYGTAVSLAAHFPVSYPGVYFVVLAIPLALARAPMADLLGAWWKALERRRERAGVAWPEVLLGAVALVHLAFALLPEVMYDAMTLHLLVPGHMAARHQWDFDTSRYVLALLPMLGNWLFTIGYMLAGETAARLINVGFILILAWLGRELVRWLGGDRRGATWAMTLFLATPLTLTESSSLFVDAIWATYLVAGLLWLLRATAGSQPPHAGLVLGGCLLGLAAATKAQTLVYLPAFALPLAFGWRRLATLPNRRPVLQGLGLLIAVGALPYAIAWALSGNPFFPFYNAVFEAPSFPPVNFDNPLFKSGVTWDLPYRIVFSSEKYMESVAGASGFQWLLLLPLIVGVAFLAGSRRAALLLGVSAAALALMFELQSYLRYVFPVLLTITALAGMALSPGLALGRVSRLFTAAAGSTLLLNLAFFGTGVWAYRDLPVLEVFRPDRRNEFLLERMPIRRAVEAANAINRERAPVAFLGPPFAAGLTAHALYDTWHNHAFQRQLEAADDLESMAAALASEGSRLVLLDAAWRTPEKRALVVALTDPVAEFGPVGLRVVKPQHRFVAELLTNPDLSGEQGWTLLADRAAVDPGGFVTVTVSRPAVQGVAVRAGWTYSNSVRARCHDAGATGRVQVNWLDSRQEFLAASIRTFACSVDWTEHEQQVVAPSGATSATVYAAADAERAVDVDRVSFKSGHGRRD